MIKKNVIMQEMEEIPKFLALPIVIFYYNLCKKKKSCLSYAKFPLGRLDEIAQI